MKNYIIQLALVNAVGIFYILVINIIAYFTTTRYIEKKQANRKFKDPFGHMYGPPFYLPHLYRTAMYLTVIFSKRAQHKTKFREKYFDENFMSFIRPLDKLMAKLFLIPLSIWGFFAIIEIIIIIYAKLVGDI